MDRQRTHIEIILAPLAGWLFLIFGLSLIGMALMIPVWLSVHQVQWQKKVMQIQAEQLDKQAKKYRQFAQALDENNPTVLERLAFVELHKQPADKTMIRPEATTGKNIADPFKPWHTGNYLTKTPNRPISEVPQSSSVDQWLAEPMPLIGVDIPAWQPPDTRMIRLCTGMSRWFMLAAGVFCALGGLWWNAKE